MPKITLKSEKSEKPEKEVEIDDVESEEDEEAGQVFVENLVEEVMARLSSVADSPTSKFYLPSSVSSYTQERQRQRRYATLG